MSKYARLIAGSDISNVLCGSSCDSLVLTFVDKTHIEMLRLFVLFWRKHELNNLIIVCLDEETIAYVNETRLNGIHVPYSITSRHNTDSKRCKNCNQCQKNQDVKRNRIRNEKHENFMNKERYYKSYI